MTIQGLIDGLLELMRLISISVAAWAVALEE